MQCNRRQCRLQSERAMTAATDIVVQLIQTDGLLLLFPLAVIEGPIVTIVAGWVGRLGYLPLGWAMLVLVLADLVGDSLLYALGRVGTDILPQKLRQVFGVTDARIALVAEHFSKTWWAYSYRREADAYLRLCRSCRSRGKPHVVSRVLVLQPRRNDPENPIFPAYRLCHW